MSDILKCNSCGKKIKNNYHIVFNCFDNNISLDEYQKASLCKNCARKQVLESVFFVKHPGLKMSKYTEILRLKMMLENADIPFKFFDICTSNHLEMIQGQIYFYSYDFYDDKPGFVIQGRGTECIEKNLLEIRGGLLTKEEFKHSDKLGYLTAEEVFERIKRKIKQIPQKPLEETRYYGNGKCPRCGAVFVDKSTNYCGNCGQALDWSGD